MTSKGANFFGQQSRGIKQIRGNGVLILTEYEIYFGMWTPKREIKIPIAAIKSVENPKSFLHRSMFSKLLKITFENNEGETDAVAWCVKDLNLWNSELEKLLRI